MFNTGFATYLPSRRALELWLQEMGYEVREDLTKTVLHVAATKGKAVLSGQRPIGSMTPADAVALALLEVMKGEANEQG